MANVFLKTALITSVIFIIGIAVGIWIDSSRLAEFNKDLEETSLSMNDAVIHSLYYQFFPQNENFCEAALKGNLEFNDNIYAQGLELQKLEDINKLAPAVIIEKKRYALLQLQFWMNAIDLKNKCDANYSNVVYLYNNKEEGSLEIDQKVQSTVLTELKQKCGNNVMLIPLPMDMGVTSINTIKNQFDITKAPSILIDEKIALQGVQDLPTLEELVNC